MLSIIGTAPWNAEDPESLFTSLLISLIAVAFLIKFPKSFPDVSKIIFAPNKCGNEETIKGEKNKKPKKIKELEWKFLSVFWLLRIALWMKGPYFYAALASISYKDAGISTLLISRIALTQYAAIPIFGPIIGKISDQYGFKFACIMGAILFAIGCLSLCYSGNDTLTLISLFVGTTLGGLGSSLINSAPENWLVTELRKISPSSSQQTKAPSSDWLGAILGKAFMFDSILAITAGKFAGYIASKNGPTGPFAVSPTFLAMSVLLILSFWGTDEKIEKAVKVNGDATTANGKDKKDSSPSGTKNAEKKTTSSSQSSTAAAPPKTLGFFQNIIEKLELFKDPKVLLLGCVQSLFESSMHVFVMKWSPILNAAIKKAFSEDDVQTPFGTIFACFMASCLIGSSMFRGLQRNLGLEASTILLLSTAASSMILAMISIMDNLNDYTLNIIGVAIDDKTRLWLIIIAFFLFEISVGVYFPTIGLLRARFLPKNPENGGRAMMVMLLNIPTNVIVVVVFLISHKLGEFQSLGIVATALVLATSCMITLQSVSWKAKRRLSMEMKQKFKMAVTKIKVAQKFNIAGGKEEEEEEEGIQEMLNEVKSFSNSNLTGIVAPRASLINS